MALTEKETLILLNRMTAGDQAAARQFYLAYEWPVRRFLRRSVDCQIPENVDLVEDAVQATMLDIWRHADRYKPNGGASFKTWLFGIATRRLIDLLRAQPELPVELDEEAIEGEVDDGYVRINESERKAALRECMQRLKPSQRQLLALAYAHDLPGREIGEIMNIPEGTVKSGLHTARNLMMKCLNRLLTERVK